MEILISIGGRLREERENMGLSQTAFAEIAEKKGATGATRQSQANYEKGKQAPSAAYLAAIASAGADVQYILTGLRMTQLPTEKLTMREAALLDNYRHTEDEGDKRVIERTAFLAAKADSIGTETTENWQKKVANGYGT